MRNFLSFLGFLIRFTFSDARSVITFLAIFIGLEVLLCPWHSPLYPKDTPSSAVVEPERPNAPDVDRGYASGRSALEGMPISETALPDWTPLRVEQRFDSGLTVVSALGPHGNFQYLVRDLPPAFAEGAYFRRIAGGSFLIN